MAFKWLTGHTTANMPGVSGDWKKQARRASTALVTWLKPPSEPSTPTRLVVVLRLPSMTVSQNDSHCHWRIKARAVKAHRTEAAAIVCEEMRRLGIVGPWPSARVSATMFFRIRARRDPHNLPERLKPILDGIADAGLVANDRDLIVAPPREEVDRESPRIELCIERTDQTERTEPCQS